MNEVNVMFKSHILMEMSCIEKMVIDIHKHVIVDLGGKSDILYDLDAITESLSSINNYLSKIK